MNPADTYAAVLKDFVTQTGRDFAGVMVTYAMAFGNGGLTWERWKGRFEQACRFHRSCFDEAAFPLDQHYPNYWGDFGQALLTVLPANSLAGLDAAGQSMFDVVANLHEAFHGTNRPQDEKLHFSSHMLLGLLYILPQRNDLGRIYGQFITITPGNSAEHFATALVIALGLDPRNAVEPMKVLFT